MKFALVFLIVAGSSTFFVQPKKFDDKKFFLPIPFFCHKECTILANFHPSTLCRKKVFCPPIWGDNPQNKPSISDYKDGCEFQCKRCQVICRKEMVKTTYKGGRCNNADKKYSSILSDDTWKKEVNSNHIDCKKDSYYRQGRNCYACLKGNKIIRSFVKNLFIRDSKIYKKHSSKKNQKN